jgi:hypothetical protein
MKLVVYRALTWRLGREQKESLLDNPQGAVPVPPDPVEAKRLGNARRRRQLRKRLIIYAVTLIALVSTAWVVVTQPLFFNVKAVETPPVSPARLESRVRALCQTFHPRDDGHPKNLDRAAAYIRSEFEQAGGKVSEQPFEVRGKTYRNVIALFGPDTDERIVVGAHYDSVGPTEPSADDNASGVAGLIELAHLLGRAQLTTRVELVAYTLEEPPHFRTPQMGSAVHAASLKKQGVKVRAMFSLECIGYFSDAPGSQEFPLPVLKLFYPTKGNFIAVAGNFGQCSLTRRVKKAMRSASPLPVYSLNGPANFGVDASDQLSYWKEGYPAVMITDSAFFRNKNYHMAQDTPDTLDYDRMTMVVQSNGLKPRAPGPKSPPPISSRATTA